jgi:thiosulfate/3-mercaptopyruvate sulfurtransferase
MGTNGYANPGALVETEWLQAHLEAPSVRVVEVNEDVTAYATDHIPGAVRC